MFPVAPPDPRALPRTSLSTISVEHIRIDSIKSYADTRATLEKLPHFDDRIRTLLQYGDIDAVSPHCGKFRVMQASSFSR